MPFPSPCHQLKRHAGGSDSVGKPHARKRSDGKRAVSHVTTHVTRQSAFPHVLRLRLLFPVIGDHHEWSRGAAAAPAECTI